MALPRPVAPLSNCTDVYNLETREPPQVLGMCASKLYIPLVRPGALAQAKVKHVPYLGIVSVEAGCVVAEKLEGF